MPPRTNDASGGFANRHEFRHAVIVLAGRGFANLLPQRKLDDAYDWISSRWRSKYHSRIDHDEIVKTVRIVLGERLTDIELRDCATHYHEWRMEDLWARWMDHKSKHVQIRTEVTGIEHLAKARKRGKGTLFWGMTCCGTLFPKIALSRSGCRLTQLSTLDHGAWFPLTTFGKFVAGPLHCHPEDNYLTGRIRIPGDGSNVYLRRIAAVLKDNGVVWMAGERTRAKKLVSADFLGDKANFPVGAPVLALRHKATLLPVTTQRMGRFHYRVTILPQVSLENHMSRREAIQHAVQVYADHLSSQLAVSPGDWDWNHLWVQSFAADRARLQEDISANRESIVS